MISVYPYQSLGSADYGWLKTRYHFSFSEYHNPDRMGFGTLRVINDDTIQPGTGFPLHPHRNMEIITYVTEGAITHTDSEGNKGRTEAGDVQVMSAGKGIAHSEYNMESGITRLFQIWITPKTTHINPSWTTHQFPKQHTENSLQLLVSGDGKAPLSIHQDAQIYAGNLGPDQTITHHLKGQAYLVVTEGELTVDGVSLHRGDGAEITNTDSIALHSQSAGKLLLIEV